MNNPMRKQNKFRIRSLREIIKTAVIVTFVFVAMQTYTQIPDVVGNTTLTSTSSLATDISLTAPESRDFDLANKQSFGFFDDIDEKNWKNLQKIVSEMVDHQKPDDPLQHLPDQKISGRKSWAWTPYFVWYQTVSPHSTVLCICYFLIVMFIFISIG